MKLTAMQQFKLPEVATDGAMAYIGMQLDQGHHVGSDTYQQGQPDVIIGSIMTGVHGAAAVVGLISSAVYAGKDYPEPPKARVALAQGLWEGMKTAGFALQIGGMGLAGAALVGCGTLGDACSGWGPDFVTSWQDGRAAKKNSGPQGCRGPED